MTSLIGTITRRKILPRSPSTQNPQQPIQYSAGIAPTPTTPVRPRSKLLVPLNERPDILPPRFKKIGHAFYLQPIGSTRKCLFDSFVGEMGSVLGNTIPANSQEVYMRRSSEMVWPKALVWLLLISIASGASMATCVGADPCNACKNCKNCKHCAKEGGTCGVCK
jgi:hypothetical protein